ncbi:MAG: NAD(P)-dependent oxidoreductase [Pseudomonadota bacterium]
MRVFLTGGTGFVGLALAARWAMDGAEVIASADVPPPDWAKAVLPDVRFEVLDVRDRDAFISAVTNHRPDVLVHGAALTPDETRERAGGTAAIFEINVAGTANALEAAAAAGVGRVLAFSSGAAYGRTLDEVDVLDEATTECRPTALYAISKLAAEKVALRLGDLHGISVVTPRLSAAWGPWEYRTWMRQTLSPGYQILEAVVAGGIPRVAAGEELPLIFSEDAADMLVRLAQSDAEGPVNIGSADMVELSALAAQAVAEARGRGQPVDGPDHTVELFAPRRPPMTLNRLAAAIGDWNRTSMPDAVARSFDWYETLPTPRPF